MLRIARHTRRPGPEVIARAVAYFGPGALGLKIRHQSGDHVTLEGGGGFVTVNAVPESAGQHEVTVVTQEWEVDAREFISQV